MGIIYACDICGRRMQENDDDRYIFKIEIYAAAPTLELTKKDLEKDHAAEIQRLVEQLSKQDPDQVESAVYRKFHYDLCRTCQKKIMIRLQYRDDSGLLHLW